MDFYKIRTNSESSRKESTELFPDFKVGGRSKDLMIRGGKFYAVWDEESGFWSQNADDVVRLVDQDLAEYAKAHGPKQFDVKYMAWDRTRTWHKFVQYLKESPDNFRPLDTNVLFANSEVRKEDYASFRLSYDLGEGSIEAWDTLVSRLYNPVEREKFEWAIGAIISGDAKEIQKFLVFYGATGTGKSTILDLIYRMFNGYCAAIDGKALGSSNGRFAMDVFASHPLVAIQHDTDLSKIENNARLNSIISHEEMIVEEKYKSSYPSRIDAMLFMGSNQPVRISDARSGIIRRLIDVHPTGITFPPREWKKLVSQVGFEMGAVAWHCLQVYRRLGPDHYKAYKPTEMVLQTDVFYNFIEDHFDVFKSQDHITLTQAWALYKEWCEETGVKYRLERHKMREELRNYFVDFSQSQRAVGGKQMRSVYTSFIGDKFRAPVAENGHMILVLDETKSLFDEAMKDQPAQLAKPDGTPSKTWKRVTSRLEDIGSSNLHFVKVPPGHIVIDFDLKDAEGRKALERNLAAASHWPSTYAEISKGGDGIHLHYVYDGDVSQLASQFGEGIEVKTFSGDASLRRRLSRCNAIPVANISSGLPLKKQEKMLKPKTITTEKGLRDLITRNLRKEIHPGTKPSVDFIKKILDDAYESGMTYDLSDMRSRIVAFANNSSNQASASLKIVKEMKWKSDEEIPGDGSVDVADDRIAFFDVEVYPNLFVVCWKFLGSDTVVEMVNPTPFEIEQLFSLKLVGFYNRRFDNHIIYAAGMGWSNADLYKLAVKLIDGNKSAAFGAAYNLSYADVWDFSSEKMSLKKFEIKLGILHMELDLPWDQPVDERDWSRVAQYCANDVRATEAVFEDRKGDFAARQILAELSGLTVNDTTQTHTSRIIFGGDKHPQEKFNYTDLSETFPGYRFELGKSYYKDEEPGEGGYVYAEPGIYENVAVLDVVSMHPTSIEILNLFGPYTKNFSDLKAARVAIKQGDYGTARKMLGGKLAPFLVPISDTGEVANSAELAWALKLVVNTVYGLTSAKFDNSFRDFRNVDNIVAKRGALFMIDLKKYLQDAGYQVIHIKTDSVKIPQADETVIELVKKFGELWGYEFDHEETYDKFCLVNDAVYVAGTEKVPWDGGFPGYDWKTVGAQFQHPYVYKTLFSDEDVGFKDLCEARSVLKGAMYLDITGSDLDQPDHTKMRHVGRTGLFVPVLEGGGVLYRVHEDRYYAVSGTKNHLWMEAHTAKELGDRLRIDMSYFEKLQSDAVETIKKFGDYRKFVER